MLDNYAVVFLVLLACVAALWITLAIIRQVDRNADEDLQLAHRRVLAAAVATACVVALLAAVQVYLHTPPRETRRDLISLALVAAFSGLVGFTEIAQRYRDRPFKLLTAAPALVYVYINMAGGIAALTLVDEFEVFGNKTPYAPVYRVMLAGFGAVAFFRSSFFTARVGTEDIDVGPATLLKGLLTVTDELINRWQAADRAKDIAETMKGINFAKAKSGLPTLCFASVQFITEQQQQTCAKSLLKLETEIKDNDQCSLILGIYLTQLVGPEVLRSAVRAMGDSIKGRPTDGAPPPLEADGGTTASPSTTPRSAPQ